MYDIKKAAVLGSGVMGGAIAAHLANAGLLVTLLDIVPGSLTPEEEAKGLTLQDKTVRNRIALQARDKMANARVMQLYTPGFIKRITFGNLDDDLGLLREADWVVEAVVENLAVKKQLLGKIEPFLKPRAIISTNTSGISVDAIAEALPPARRERFLVTHFFNPPRFMKLLELVPGTATSGEVTAYMAQYCEAKLGKGVVKAKDTPGFIANRIGVYSLALVAAKMRQYGLSVEEADALTGGEIGRPNTGTFRLIDMVGLDTLIAVADYQGKHVQDEQERKVLAMPEFFARMQAKGYLGDKKKQGFYKKTGQDTQVIDIASLEYRDRKPVELGSLAAAKSVKDLPGKLGVWLTAEDTAARFVWDVLKDTLLFAGSLIPEVADDAEAVDNAMKWGYNWEIGPFELWDMIGLPGSAARMKAEGAILPPFVAATIADGRTKFHDETAGAKDARKITAAAFLGKAAPALGNSDASLFDMGDGVACFVIHSPNSSATDKLVDILPVAIAEVEKNYLGMVIAGSGKNFCVGANLPMVLQHAEAKNWAAIETLSAAFQNAFMAIKYCAKPVVAAPYGMTLGGGAEMAISCAAVLAQGETAIGLVESSVGLLPGGGGNKELLFRLTEPFNDTPAVDLEPFVRKAFDAIAAGAVSASGADAWRLGLLGERDGIVMHPDYQLHRCKQTVRQLAETMVPRNPAGQYRVAGEGLYANLKAELYNKRRGGFISDHDVLIGGKIAHVLCGGKVPADTFVSEQYLLDLERECFVSLCGEAKTRERIAYMLKNRKPLRN